MHTQIQCPVCTLYLHVGMNLHVHLDTHPKDQVIRALVNMTVLQTHEEEETQSTNQMTCSRYAPLQDETNFETPPTSETQTQISPTPVIQSIAPSINNPPLPIISSIQYSQPESAISNQFQTKSYPPPPPYEEHVKLIGRRDTELLNATVQSHDQIRCVQKKVRNELTNEEGFYTSPITTTATNEEYQDENDEFTDFQIVYETTDLCDVQPNHEDNIQEDVDPDQQHIYDLECTDQTEPIYNDYIDSDPLVAGGSHKSSDNPVIRNVTQLLDHGDVHNEKNYDTRSRSGKQKQRVSGCRQTNGLKVLSDVTLTPDLSITSIINVKTLKSSDRIGLTDMFLGSQSNQASSSLASTFSKDNITTQRILTDDPDGDKTIEDPPKEVLGDISTSLPVEENPPTIDCDSDDCEIIEINEIEKIENRRKSVTPEPPNTPERNIIILKAVSLSPNANANQPSSAVTSVIRMAASPHKPLTNSFSEESTIEKSKSPQPSTSKQLPTPFSKPSFTKTPKKLVVKFKKPFVPVIEEEANLQPPDRPNDSFSDTTVHITTEKSDESIKHRENDTRRNSIELPEAIPIDSHPFSPFRRSITPAPEPIFEITSGINDIQMPDDADTNVTVKYEDSQYIISNTIPNKPSDESKEFPFGIDREIKVEAAVDTYPPPSSYVDSGITSASFVSIGSSNASPHEFMSSGEAQPGTSTSQDNDEICLKYDTRDHLNEQSSIIDCGPINFFTNDFERPISPISSTPMDSSTSQSCVWTQCLSPQYVPFEIGKSSYTNLDESKTHSQQSSSFDGGDRTTGNTTVSSESVNIRTDEQMPAKGEISEQESNGDVDGSWSQQAFTPLQNNGLRYPSSYDTTVARESWSLSNASCEFSENCCNSMQMPTFAPLDTMLNEDIKIDVKPNMLDVFNLQQPTPSVEMPGPSQPSTNDAPKTLQSLKLRRFRCYICPNVYTSLKEKRAHLSIDHQIQAPLRRNKVTATITSSSSCSTSNNTQNHNVEDRPPVLPQIKIEEDSLATTKPLDETILPSIDPHKPLAKKKVGRKLIKASFANSRFSRLNMHLLNFNWTVLRDRICEINDPNNDFQLPINPKESNTFICMVCQELFKSVRAFDQHMAIHPTECYTCGREFRHWYNFSIHLKRHLNIKDHQCKHCPKRFVSRPNLAEHMTMHSAEARLECKICKRRFRRQSNLIIHRKREHLNIRPSKKDFICWCGEVFHTKAKIAWHREKHEKVPKCCPYCRERFVHSNSLSRHIRISHTDKFVPGSGSEMVTCTVCLKKFLKTSIKLHMVTHDPNPNTNGTLEYGCTICNKSFTTKWNLKQHKWVHASRSSKPFQCTICPKAFVREADFTTHVNTHKSIKPYTCDHCGLQFARKYNWLRHTREHEKPKGHKCDDCGKIFHRAYYLTEHRRTHTGERPFECNICGKLSTTKTNHNKHVKIHHARDPLLAEG